MMTVVERSSSANRLYSPECKSDFLGEGRFDTTTPGWGQRLADGIKADLESYGIPSVLIHEVSIDDDGLARIDYEGMAGRMKRERGIYRSDHEIADNQLRELINDMVRDVSNLILKMASETGYVYANKIFYGSKIGLGLDARPTCRILSRMSRRHAICESAMFRSDASNECDCRKCNIPQLFQLEAREIVESYRRR